VAAQIWPEGHQFGTCGPDSISTVTTRYYFCYAI